MVNGVQGTILHITNLVYVKQVQAYKANFMPSLAYTFIKNKVLMLNLATMKGLSPKEIGGYVPIDTTNWKTKAIMQNQQPWRCIWLCK